MSQDLTQHDILYMYPPAVLQKLMVDGRDVYTLFGNVLPPTEFCDADNGAFVNCRTFSQQKPFMTDELLRAVHNPQATLLITQVPEKRCYRYQFMT